MTSTPASSGPHIDAVVKLLDDALTARSPSRHAYNGKRPPADTACAVVYGGPGEPSGTLGDRYADIEIPFQVTGVGTGPEQALAIADAARAALLGSPPVVSGRSVWPLWQTASQPVQRDDTVQPPLFIATAQYAIKSNPA